MWNPGEDVDSAKKEKKNSPSSQQLSLAELDEGELSQTLEASVIMWAGRVGIWADGRFCTSTYPPYHPSAITLFTRYGAGPRQGGSHRLHTILTIHSHRCRRLPIVPTYAYKACSRAGKTRALVGLAGLKHALRPREAYRVSGAVLYEVLYS
ncbi:hypothetical protein LX32DRAFT_218500 [Colletotrichum zoysiae]|uniref:Uncharacterized protein n=1 Tax=Colletotrichum zoysiae TaxID=1216348 RepID=A0AAD9M524_9PEZI|nr:hypothetical protein LX32DRAFT_218500 [Colletotrichum zoysiae]